MRDTCVGEQRDVREGYTVANKERRCRQVMLHPRQRGIATLDLVRIEIGYRLAEIDHLEAAPGYERLVAVLLPEQPFIHLSCDISLGRGAGAAPSPGLKSTPCTPQPSALLQAPSRDPPRFGHI